MINIQAPSGNVILPLFQMGFRPFFLGASLFSICAMSLWMGMSLFHWDIETLSLYQTLSNWHAHEMVFGYTLAVVAGFLLTAVRNWTGVQTAGGVRLMLLFSLWLLARITPYFSGSLLVVASLDLMFDLFLLVLVVLPLYRAGMWPNIGLVGMSMLLILMANLVFYSGLAGIVTDGAYYGISAGVYLILALIFLMGRRVIPFFIEKAVGGDVQLKNYKVIDIAIPVCLLVFAIIDIIEPSSTLAALLAALLVIINIVRLAGWYVAGIWRAPLLWVLYIAYGWVVFGFVLKAATLVFNIPPALDIHAYTYGGIGLMTIGMMARISLGHTGRNIYAASKLLPFIFILMVAGCFLRVVFPLFMGMYYGEFIAASQLLWILANVLFLIVYTPIFIQPRIDGRPG